MSDVSEEIRERVAAKMDRLDRNQRALDERVYRLIGVLSVDDLRRLATIFYDELGNIAEHLPEEREGVKRFACTGNSYHGCSYRTPHQQGCKAIGGDGNLVGAYPNARSCEPDCDESAPEEPWCQACGFDCPGCEMVDQLLGLLAAHEHTEAAQ